MKKYFYIFILLLNTSVFALAPSNISEKKLELLYSLFIKDFKQTKSIYFLDPMWFLPYLEVLSFDEIMQFVETARKFQSFANYSIPFLNHEIKQIREKLPILLKYKFQKSNNSSIDLTITVSGLGYSFAPFHDNEIIWLFEEIIEVLKKNFDINLRNINLTVNAFDIQPKILDTYKDFSISMIEKSIQKSNLPIIFKLDVKPYFADLLNPICRKIVCLQKSDIFIWRNTHLLDYPNFQLSDMFAFICSMKESLNEKGFLLVHETNEFGESLKEVLKAS